MTFAEFPKMLYKGDGSEYVIVEAADEEEIALADGWRVHPDPLDHDGDGHKGGARRGRKPKAG